MALLFMDGFDHYATADIAKKWSAAGANATIAPTSGRRGGGACYMSVDGSGAYLRKTISATTVIVGFAFKFNATLEAYHFIFRLMRSGSYVAALNYNASGVLEVWGASFTGSNSSVAFTDGGYHYIEFKLICHSTTGSYELRLDGALVASGTNKNTGSGAITDVEIGSSGGADASPKAYYADIYICDASGTANNDFLGDIRIDTIYPNGAGTHQSWSPSSGTDHAALVDEAAPNTTDYLAGGAAGTKETLGLQDLSVNGTIFGVQVNNAVAKSDTGTCTIKNLIRSDTSEASGPTFAPLTEYTYSKSIHETDPATGSAWLTTAINALEAGAEVVS